MEIINEIEMKIVADGGKFSPSFMQSAGLWMFFPKIRHSFIKRY